MGIEFEKSGRVKCPVCDNSVEVRAPKGAEIGEVGEEECEDEHKFRVRLGEKQFTVLPEE